MQVAAAGTQTKGSPVTALQEHATSVLCAVRMGHMLLAQDTTRLLQSLVMDVVVPLTAFCDVDNMHADLFKKLQLQDGQRSAMANFWQQWETRRRVLDETTSSAMEQLDSVPVTLHIPDCVQTEIHVLCGYKKRALAASETVRLGAVQPGGAPAEAGLLAPSCGAGVKEVGAHRLNAYQRGGQMPSCGVLEGEEAYGIDASMRHKHEELDVGVLVGQSGVHTDAARTALKLLVSVHDADKEMYIDSLDAQMPAAILSAAQVMQLSSTNLMHDGAPFDFLSLCKMAASQERRICLLSKVNSPFTGTLPVL